MDVNKVSMDNYFKNYLFLEDEDEIQIGTKCKNMGCDQVWKCIQPLKHVYACTCS